jgi:hypothetical protein
MFLNACSNRVPPPFVDSRRVASGEPIRQRLADYTLEGVATARGLVPLPTILAMNGQERTRRFAKINEHARRARPGRRGGALSRPAGWEAPGQPRSASSIHRRSGRPRSPSSVQ